MVRIIMVIRLETRVEKNKRLKKEKRKRNAKAIAIIFIMILMILGLSVVNAEIKRKDFLENTNLFKLNIGRRSFDLLGKKYYIDFNAFTKYLP